MRADRRRCTARSKRSGRRCTRPAVPGKRVCHWHGGRSTGPRTREGKAASSQNALKQGIYVERILNDGERQVYAAMVEDLSREYGLDGSSDRSSVEAFGMAFVQLVRAMKAGHAQAAAVFDRRMRHHLNALKGDDDARTRETADVETTPAERATALVEKGRKADHKERGKARGSVPDATRDRFS